jgi:hypothetical protein
VTLAGKVLPEEASVTVVAVIGFLPKSASVTLYAPEAPSTSEEGPVSVRVVPTTGMMIFAVLGPTVAVTVMLRLVGSPAAESDAVAVPVASVVPWVTVRPPEVAAKVTGTPVTKLLLAFLTRTLIVADFELSDGICGRLV